MSYAKGTQAPVHMLLSERESVLITLERGGDGIWMASILGMPDDSLGRLRETALRNVITAPWTKWRRKTDG